MATKLRKNWLMIWTDRRGNSHSRRYCNHALACRDARAKGGKVEYSSEGK